ncbi:hypothetical protein [Desulfomonile tiedjei]|uniref:Uncharacterized protein n=1 Tax=Desulfomonile tiedjei (strain ATCC 49306 / DSM 6799 / DCB-1) TaxID=706587 RepID=I4C8S2_DESTA|nr:hypothetical protein [Desulfomonile tiedjei]AFM25963.1 hypothetical protein Desti_3305 [Desulfomonile tiedjei DSM 6799]
MNQVTSIISEYVGGDAVAALHNCSLESHLMRGDLGPEDENWSGQFPLFMNPRRTEDMDEDEDFDDEDEDYDDDDEYDEDDDYDEDEDEDFDEEDDDYDEDEDEDYDDEDEDEDYDEDE